MATKQCKTRKRRFRDELGAKIALARCAWKDRDETRVYRCPFCKGWHLTSQSLRRKDAGAKTWVGIKS